MCDNSTSTKQLPPPPPPYLTFIGFLATVFRAANSPAVSVGAGGAGVCPRRVDKTCHQNENERKTERPVRKKERKKDR